MKYALLIYETKEAFARRAGEDAPAYWAMWSAFTKAVEEAGVKVGGAGLQGPETSTSIRLGSSPVVQDGPYADSKDQLGGFYLIDVPDLDAALAWAARVPATGGLIEVRPLLAM